MKPTLFALATLAMSMPCFADFDYVGKGTTANSAGQQTPFTFGFAWDSESKVRCVSATKVMIWTPSPSHTLWP